MNEWQGAQRKKDPATVRRHRQHRASRVTSAPQITSDRQTDSFNWDTNPHTPRLYFKPAPPLHHPRYTVLQGLHQLIMDVEKYYASPAGSRRLMAPPVMCGESRCSDVYH